jgi:hypothetical protein
MMNRMKYRLPALVFAVIYSLATPLATLASSSSSDEDQTPIDARLQGYQSGTAALNNASGTALTWLLLCVLTAICVGVLFMNPKRSHLD